MAGKTDIIIRSIITGFALGFLALIVYVSLLGDNHKIDFAVHQYFEAMKAGDYNRYCDLIPVDRIPKAEDCIEAGFILDSAMMMKYGYEDPAVYDVSIRKSHFRIPWVTDDVVRISLALVPKEKPFLETVLGKLDKPVYITDMMTVKKVNNLWTIVRIGIDDETLKTALEKTAETIDLEKYIVKTENGFQLSGATIVSEKFTPGEKRLFEYSMKRLSGL